MLFFSFWVVLGHFSLLLNRCSLFWVALARFKMSCLFLGCFESAQVSLWLVLACSGLFWLVLSHFG